MNNKNILTHKFLPILGLVFFILFILLINNSFASISGPFTTNDGYIYNEFPDLPTEISNYKYYLICGYYTDYGSAANRVCLLYSNEPFYFFKEDGGRCLLYSVNLCDLGYCYYINSSDYSVWKTSNVGIYRKDINNAHYYLLNSQNPIIFISNEDVLNKRDGSIFYKANKGYESMFYLSNTEPTYDYPQILSQEFDYYNLNNYEAYISLDDKKWDSFNIEYVYINEDGSPQENSPFIYYYNVFENGNYHIKLFDNSTGQYIYDDYIEVTNLLYEIILEPDEDTDKPIIAKTNLFNSNIGMSVSYSTDRKNWEYINVGVIEDTEDESSIYDTKYYWTRIFKNGVYYFDFHILYDENGKEINEHYYVTKEITNLIIEDYMSDDYIFKPIISLDYNEETEAFIVRTQSLVLDKALNLKCFYIAYDKSDGFNPNEVIEDTEITSWNEMEIDFEHNPYMMTDDAYFYFEIPIINATDTNYKIAFYNYFSEKSSEIVYYDFVYDSAKDYVENDLKVHLGISVYLNDLLKTFESKLGILGFPFSVVRNFSNKILTLQVKEPILYIPELYEPFYNNKIFNGISFNFNSLLVSDSVIFIHEFYLIIVDMIFIFLFLVYCVKAFKSFIDKDN